MGSYIQIDSIYIDLTNSVGKRDAGKCENFSIRGYVSETHKKDWKIWWPFPIDKSEEKPSLPPLDISKCRCQFCKNCPHESAANCKDIDKDDRINFDCGSIRCRYDTNCSNAALKSATQHDPMPNTLVRRDIDLNTNPCCDSDFLPFSNEKEKKAGVVLDKRIDLKTDLEDNLNHQVTTVSSPKICPGLIQEVYTTKKGCEDNGVSGVELASNHKCMDKSSAEIYNGGTPSAENQCQKESIKACTILGDSPTAIKANNTTNHTTGNLPLDSVACNHIVPSGSMHTMVENDFHGHNLEKSTALSRRRPRKVRLMTDLLSENSGLKNEQITIQGSLSCSTSNASKASQVHSIFPGKMDTQGDLSLTNMCQTKKRKFLLDEARSPEDMTVQGVAIAVQKEDATKYKDVMTGIGLQDATKGYWSKSETERNHIMSKKSRKIQVIDNHLIPEPHQGQQRENEDTVDTADKAFTSKTLYPGSAPCAFMGKGMGKFPFHALRIENEFSLSNGKGKIMQTDGELDSLSYQENGMRVENSFAFSGEKIMSNIPVTIPIPSAQGALNGNGLEKGLQLYLNSHLTAQVYNKKCIHQIENRLTFPLTLKEGTSNVHQQKRKDNETNVFGGPIIPSRHITNAISGKGVRCEETTGVRNKEKVVEAVEQLGVAKRYSEQTMEVPEQGMLDGIPMEIVELLAKNQYERCLPDVENRSSMLDKSNIKRKTQMTFGSTVYGKGDLSLLKESKKKYQGTHKKSSMATRGENVKPSKRKPANYFSPFDRNNLGMNNVYPPQSPFSHMGSSHLGSGRNCKFNGSIEERGSSNATLQAQGGCSLHKTILRHDDEASRIWASLTSNHVSQGYDVPKKAVFQPTSANLDITSLQAGALHKQGLRRDVDLNCRNSHVAGPEMLNRNIGPGTFGKMNGGYPFPGKHNGMEPHQNMRGSMYMYSNETIPAMHLLSLMDAGKHSLTPFNEGVNSQMRRRPSYHGDCSTKLEIGTSKPHSTPKRQLSDYHSRSYLSDKSGGYFLGFPSFVPSLSTQHDMKYIRANGAFAGRNLIEFGKKEMTTSSNSAMQNGGSSKHSWPHRETEIPVQHNLDVRSTRETMLPVRVTLGSSCMVNRNPADFIMPETGNAYMINGEDLKFEKIISKKRPCFPTPQGCRQQRNLKGTKKKEHSKH